MNQEAPAAQRAFHRRNELHIARKIWHFLGVMTIATIFYFLDRVTAIQTMAIATFFAVSIDFLRTQNAKVNERVIRVFQIFMREHEKTNFAGTTYLFLGVFAIILFFPKQIVLLSLLFLAVADPLASYIGILYGRDRVFGHKSLQGSFAAFFACVVVAGIFYSTNGLMMERLFLASLCSGIVGALSELIPIFRLDDNLTFPIVSSAGLWVVFYFFGGF